LYIDLDGIVKAFNHKTGDTAEIKFDLRGWTTSSVCSGTINDKFGNVKYRIEGTWLERLYLINAENAATPNTDDITAHSQMYSLLNQQRDSILKNKTTIEDNILKGNLDAVKGSVYADRYLTDMSTRMSSIETSRKSELELVIR
jgi:hypothetical protein